MSNTDKALKMMENAKKEGRLSIDNPQELMNKLTERYGDNAYNLVRDSLMKPSEVMGKMGEKPTTSAETLKYLAGNEISQENIAKMGGQIQVQAQQLDNPVETNQAPVHAGMSSAYGNAGNTAGEAIPASNNSPNSNNNEQGNNGNNSSSNSLWGNIFDNLMSGDLGKMIGAALAIQLANQATLAWSAHYQPYPLATHPYRARIEHFDNYVEQSKAERTLHQVAEVAHGVSDVAHGVSHVITAAKMQRA